MAPASGMRFLAPSELLTLSGAVTAVFFVTQGIRHAFGWNPRYLALLLSLLVAFAGVAVQDDHTPLAWAVALPNGFMIYATSVGFASMTGRRQKPKPETNVSSGEEIAGTTLFWVPWY